MTTKNIDIRERAKASGLKLWQIADKLGVTDGTFSKKLRKELSESEKVRVFEIIAELVEGGEEV